MFKSKFYYSADQDIITLTPTLGTIAKAVMPSLVYAAIGATLLFWPIDTSLDDLEEKLKENGHQ